MVLLRALARLHDALSRITAVLGAACLGGIVLLYGTEVVMRYWLLSPTSWTAAVAVYLMLGMVMLTAPLLTARSEHVTASVIETIMPPRVARFVATLLALTACAVCLTAAWFALQETLRSHARGVLTTDTLYIPRWWLLSLLVYGLTSSAVHFLRHFLAGLKPTNTAGAAR